MAIKSLDHVNIRTSKARETMNFYTEILDFSEGFRPPFNFPGAWLYAGENAVIHLVFEDSESSNNYNKLVQGVSMTQSSGYHKFKHMLT